MLTLPTLFEKYRERDGAAIRWIVKLSDGTNTYYFSDQDGQLTDGQIFGLLLQGAKSTQSVNHYSRQSSIGKISLVFSNAPAIDGSRLSDLFSTLWDDIHSGSVEVYKAVGPVTALSDCLKMFGGQVIARPSYDAERITVVAEDLGGPLRRLPLPLLKYGDLTDSTSYDNDRKLAIVAGDWRDLDPWGNGNYLVRGMRDPDANKLYVCNHEVRTIVSIWFYFESVDIWVKLDHNITKVTKTEGGIKRSVADIFINKSTDLIKGYAYIPATHLTDIDWTGSQGQSNYEAVENIVSDESKAWDKDNETFAELWGKGGAYAFAKFGFSDIDVDWNYDYSGAREARLYWRTAVNSNLTYQYGFEDPPGLLHTTVVCTYKPHTNQLYIGSSSMHDGTVNYMSLADQTGWDIDTDVGWQFGTEEFRAMFPVHCTAGNYEREKFLDIFQVQLRIPINLNRYWEDLNPIPYFELDGYEYGSEIATRNPSAAAGNSNKWAGYQIERICRETLGLSASQIDGDTFDDRWTESFETRFMLTHDNETTVEAFFQKLCENSDVLINFNPAGKIRCLSLVDHPSSADITFGLEDLVKPPKVWSTEPDKIVNHLDSRYQMNPTTRNFNASEGRENTSSKTKYGDRHSSADYEYLWSTGGGIQQQLVSFSNSFFAWEHDLCLIQARGVRGSHVEIGDVFALDATVSATLKRWGSDWTAANTYFVVYVKNELDQSTELIGIRLISP